MRIALCCIALVLSACSHRMNPLVRGDEIGDLQQRIRDVRASLQLDAGDPGERCRKMRAAADEICRCSDRICVLAEELMDRPSANACAQSREDCGRARTDAADCK